MSTNTRDASTCSTTATASARPASATPCSSPRTRGPEVTRSHLEELALFGGRPHFSEPLHVGRPNVGDREALHARLDEILDARWLSNDGPQATRFEGRVADYVGVRHCIAMCNAT